MPKLVDPDARRGHVVDALFRVVVRDGLSHASLRTVADEAGLNIGSLRHYFTSQQDLMRFAMRAMIDRVAARLTRHLDRAGDLAALPPARQRQRLVDLLAELLPLDDARRVEVAVFIDFVAAARTNPALVDLADTAAKGTRAIVERALVRLRNTGALRADLDIPAETERLVSLVDGLGLNAVLHPAVTGVQTCDAALRVHVESLAAPTDRAG